MPPVVIATTLLDGHTSFAWFVVVGNGLAGVWALAAHWLEPLRGRALWVFTAVVEIALFVQVGLGVATMQLDGVEAPEMHLFYGFVALVAVGLIYSYRNQMKGRTYLLYGGGGLFLMGLGIRAMFLA